MKATSVATRLLSLSVLLLLASFVLLTPLGRGGAMGGQATFCLGFILLFGYYLARLLSAAHLPAITSYILVGILCGPFFLNLLSEPVVESLQRLDDVALAIIALIAGGELRTSVLRSRGAAITAVIVGQIVFAFVGAVATVYVLQGSFQPLGLDGTSAVIALGLLFGLVTVARSPATTIAVLTELRARGSLTEVIIGVTVLLDVVILFMAALILPAAETLVLGTSFSMQHARELAVVVVGSIAAGVFFGLLIRVYIRWVRGYLPLFLLGVGLVGTDVCHHFDLEPLLAFMIAGFYVVNFSRMGPRLLRGLERSSFPVYVLFFSISGASIDLMALRQSWVFAAVLVVMRFAALYLGSLFASRVVAQLKPHAHTLWSGFLAQAGVTIGIAALIERRFAWGGHVETIVLAVVAINQLIGPVALKLLIERSGESGGMDRPAPS